MISNKDTPIRRQYLEIKRQHPDAILFFRLGDFYEMFDGDAETAAHELDLVLTSRASAKDQRVPMCGVPYHAAEGYIAKLIARGYKVALCEQIGSETINGLMPREVVRVFTAGTVIEPGMLDAVRNNYLAAVIIEGERAGLAYMDISTGEFATTQIDGRRGLIEELARLTPAELILPDGEQALLSALASSPAISRLPNWRFEEGQARQTLQRHFEVSSLDAFGCQGKPLAVRAAGAILAYLQETQKEAVRQVQRLATYSTEGYMALDAATRRNLELTESLNGKEDNSLLAVLNRTVTTMGARLLRRRLTQPLLDLGALNQRLEQVDAFLGDGFLRAEVRALLRNLPDLERLTNRTLNGSASPRDLENMARVLAVVPDLQALPARPSNLSKGATAGSGADSLTASHASLPPEPVERALTSLFQRLDPCPETAALIQAAIADDAPPQLGKPGVIRPGFAAELDGVVNSTAHARQWVEKLEPRERERTGIQSLKVGFNRVFGYYIEVTKANSQLVPDDYIRKQTLTNAERYITPDLKEYETLILNAEERILEIEQRVFRQLCQRVAAAAERLLTLASTLAQLDVASGLAEAAAGQNYVRPVLDQSNDLMIRDGRHPVVERVLQLERFVPNDSLFHARERIQIITGPNMSGKSTYLRQVALIVLMAQVGSFVPASEARLGLVDRIFTRIGAHDELHAGRSTFMVEMVEAAEILHHATYHSLLILDEIGRGTSTYDGLSIAWAIVEYLHNHPRLKPRTLFATHYHELTGLSDLLPLVANYNVAVAEEGETVTFLHRIVPGGADRSYGIHVAQLAGLPRDVINRAYEILRELERYAPTAAVQPTHLRAAQQVALFPEVSPILEELQKLDVTSMTPLEAINKLYEWRRRYLEDHASTI